MRNLKLIIEYDGTDYSGWQKQANARSIQGEIENALAQILREEVTLNGAGRTDAGVHARGQVANFTTGSSVDCQTLVRGLNGILPEDIAICSAEEVADDFHARFSAVRRRYCYTIARRPVALERKTAWFLTYVLDQQLLDRAAELILGTHDFRSYCRVESTLDHYRCSVDESRWERSPGFLRYRISANRYLHGMVRSLVGTMVDVARGYMPLSNFELLFELRDRTQAGMAAPARGLVLEKVEYRTADSSSAPPSDFAP
jgi:tRNA pseudouridine38-40 synthase